MARHSIEEKNRMKFAQALESMFKNIQSGNIIYIVFSKRSFYLLVFTLAMGMLSNIILVYLILNSQILGGYAKIIYIVVFVLSVTAVVSGIWLVFKGIDIVTDKGGS